MALDNIIFRIFCDVCGRQVVLNDKDKFPEDWVAIPVERYLKLAGLWRPEFERKVKPTMDVCNTCIDKSARGFKDGASQRQKDMSDHSLLGGDDAKG